MSTPLKILGVVFFVVGTVFLLVGLVWLSSEMEMIENGINEMLIGPGSICFMGLVFASIGGGVLLRQRRIRQKRDMLMRTGRKIQGTVTRISKNHRIKVNNRHPHIVECTAVLSGQEKKFMSANIYGALLLNEGDTLDVFVDFRNYDNYWVEVPPQATR